MTDPRWDEFVAFKAVTEREIATLKRFRSRLVELVPVGTFMAVVIVMVGMQFALGGRVSTIEGRLGGLEGRVAGVEVEVGRINQRLDQMQATLVEISRTLGRLEGKLGGPP